MKNTKLIIVFFCILLLTLGCNIYKNKKQIILGNWYFLLYRDKDQKSSPWDYAEVYITESHFLFFFHGNAWLDYKYDLRKDTIYRFSDHDTTIIKLKIMNKNKIIFNFIHSGEIDTLHRLKTNEYTIEDYIREKNIQELKDAFYTRKLKQGVDY